MKKDVAKIMFIVMILSSIFVSSAYADVDDKKLYMIIFKQAEPGEIASSLQNLIENGIDTSQIISSGTAEAKQGITDELNLDGEVIAIVDGSNGILANIDQIEADRLSALDQVESIEEDSIMTADLIETPFEVGDEEHTPPLSTQKNSGWGLARIHQSTATSDSGESLFLRKLVLGILVNCLGSSGC
jgi:microcompartment protein CcmK/EutM